VVGLINWVFLVLLVSVGWVLSVRVWVIGLAPVLGSLSRPAVCMCVVFFLCFATQLTMGMGVEFL
jgi:hypothetical protein